jgi:UTP-glucose-1-phosphate uridylyltransferase
VIPVTSVVQRASDLPAGAHPSAHAHAGARAKPWGTGHAVLTVREHVRGPFAIMNADDFYGAAAYQQGAQAADLAAARGHATVVAMRLDNTLSPFGPVKRGWAQTRDGHVTRLEEVMGIARQGDRLVASGRHADVKFDGSELVSMNFWVFPAEIFPALEEKFHAFLREHAAHPDAEFLLPEVINELIAEGRLTVHAREAPGPWFGLTYQEDKAEVASGLADLTKNGVYPPSLW